MKKLSYVIIAILTISLSGCSIFQGGNKSFEGVIKYSIDVEGDVDDQTMAALPTGVTEYYKGTSIRKDQESLSYSVGVITKGETGETIMLMDIPMMGQKFAYKQSKEEIEEAKAEMEDNKPEISETGETKEILGYTCKKADVMIEDDIYPVYYTTEITLDANPNENGMFEGIEGVILEYTVNQQGIVMHFTATEVKKEKVPAATFEIPEDYDVKTAEEIEAMFGGML